MGRFINADVFASTGQGLLGNNMYVYCLNNPIVFEDGSGEYTRIANPNASTSSDSYGGSGGGIIPLPFPSPSNILEWIDEQKNAIIDKLSNSLSKAKERNYRSDYEEHHMTARTSPNAAPAAAILNKLLPGGVEDPLNRVFVKTAVHRRIHTKLYYSFVNELIINAYYSAEGNPHQQYVNVISTLAEIRVFVEALNALHPN